MIFSIGHSHQATASSRATISGAKRGRSGRAGLPPAHQADEYLEISEFQAGQQFMERLLERLA